jgi:hypothetical protein
MLAQGGGHVINVTTSLVDHANSDVPSVLASLTKGGLQSATKSLAIEYATTGVRVNAVAPGTIQTPMHPVESYDTLADLHPVGRMGQISDRHCCVGRALDAPESGGGSGGMRSQAVGEFVEREADPVVGGLIGRELVVASSEVLHEGMAGRDCLR